MKSCDIEMLICRAALVESFKVHTTPKVVEEIKVGEDFAQDARIFMDFIDKNLIQALQESNDARIYRILERVGIKYISSTHIVYRKSKRCDIEMEISVNIKDDYLKWLNDISKETSTDKEELIKSLLMYKLQEIGIPLNLFESDFDKGMDTLTKARRMKKSSLNVIGFEKFNLFANSVNVPIEVMTT